MDTSTKALNFDNNHASERAHLVGRVVWAIVHQEAKREARRVLLQLVGMRPEHLLGVASNFVNEEGKSVKLAIATDIDCELTSRLDDQFKTTKPPVHFRHLDEADIVLFAVTDSQRETVGSSLGQVTRLDRKAIQEKSELWLDIILSSVGEALKGEEQRTWIRSMLVGLDQSGITKELDQFTEFIRRFMSLNEHPLQNRLRFSAPALRLPTACFDSIPKQGEPWRKLDQDFRNMFRAADRDLSGLPYLLNRKEERLDVEPVLAYLEKNQQSFRTEQIQAAEVIRELVDDRKNLRHGNWRKSQEQFCKAVDWLGFGKDVFAYKARKKPQTLSQRTLNFIENEYPSCLDEATRIYLDELQSGSSSPQQDDDFFGTWQDRFRINVNDKKLYDLWRRHLFTDEETETDLLSVMVKGIRSLLIKNASEDGTISSNAVVNIRVKNAEKLSAWKALNPRLVELLRLEGQLIEKMLAPHIRFEFGKWLEAKGQKTGQSKSANQIEFELFLKIDSEIAPNKIRIFWRPGHQSIALSWPEDVKEFKKGACDAYVRYVAAPFDLKQGGTVGGVPAYLQDTSSFVDVAGTENGLLANPAEHEPHKDQFAIVTNKLSQAVDARLINASARDAVSKALEDFRVAFSNALLHMHDDPSTLYDTDLVETQAGAFGRLCDVAREKLAHNRSVRKMLLQPLVEFAILCSRNKQAAIVTAWHPLRLLERKSKAEDLALFVKSAIGNENISVDGVERAADEQQYIFKNWFFPQIISIELRPFITVEDCCGYSLAVPFDSVSNEQRLEPTARIACRQFMIASDRFIEFNPHEEGNFSTALYNADAVSLAGLVAKDLEKRMNKNSLLRASLLITHDSPKRLREVYVEQNSRLGGGLLDEVTEGFLSRLRVGVGKGEAAAGTRRSNIDVVFLHEAYSKNATVEWEFIEGSSKELPEKIDFRNAALPRRRTDSDAFGKLVSQAIEVYMMASRPPRAAAQFTDLCYVATHETRLLADNSRIVPIKRVDWSNQEVSRTVERAHKMGEWVVSVDSMSSRQLLASKGISVIHDVQLPDVDMRILVSSDKPSSGLVGRLESNFASMHDQYLSQNAAVLADASIEMMAEVCSQKALSSAKSITTAWEIMGLVAAAGVVNFEKSVNAVNPVWFSLDDNQAFFGLQGRMADCIALAIHKDCQRFQVAMTVVEAKCIGKASAVSEAKKSREQIASTLATIKANFATQKDIMAKRAWGRHLLSLMSLRPDYIRFFSDNMELEGFRQAIAVGDVDYSVDGRSVVVIHDDVTLLDEISTSASEENDTVLQYTLGQRSFSRIIRHLREPDLAPFPHLPQNPSNYVPSFETQTAVNPADPHSSGQEPEEQFAISNQQGKTATEVLSTQDTAISEEEDKAEKDEIVDAVSATDEVRRNESLPLELENALQEIATRKGYSQQLEAEAMFAEVSAVNLQAALTDFGMTARFSEPRTISTPNGVLVGFAGHNTLTVAKLNQKLLELKTTHGLDVTDIRTGLGRISLFVAAQKRRVVDLDRVLLEAKWPKSAPLETSNFLIGLREDTGDPLWLNLRNAFGGNEVHAPHTLIAGETGSGKGVLTQNLLLQMIALNSPESLQLYLIDPKMGVDFPWISDAPHMAHDIITDQEEAEQVLNTIVAEMDRRYSLIKTKRVPKISEYNEIVNPSERLPYIVIIHDEMADWMASSDEYRSMIQSTMTRLASKARACGIHVVMITQRAAQDAIPPGIRDNLGNRLILKVANEAGSKLALGMRGAERLLGKGHLAARLAGDKPVGEEYFVAQVPFGTTDELAIYAQAIIANFKNA